MAKKLTNKQPTRRAKTRSQATRKRVDVSPDPIGPTGRDGNGKFAPGNVGGPGRPTGRTESRYFKSLTNCIDFETFERLVENTLDIALHHEDASARLKAQSLLYDRLLPKPRPIVEADPEELRVAGYTRGEVNRIMLERIVKNMAKPSEVIEAHARD